ncbi:60S acidic ribosomal protein P1-like [Dromiciops gliroides]|uniref:60S acidic ribosomal protein P1-like n=1 Tax=Dromiciops gliroides TaxID=33562 RepID=UPI001CC3B963|nr:60S acidic ribosomal protein P1-like [Dromiciops gliroides]
MTISELTCIYSALIFHDDEVMVIKGAGINVEPFWPGLFAKSLKNVNIASLICNVGVGGPTPAAGGATLLEVLFLLAQLPQLRRRRKRKQKKKNPRSLMVTWACSF